MLILVTAAIVACSDLPVVHVDRNNFEIRNSVRVVIAEDVIEDSEGNGVIQIIGDGITVDFTGAHLRGTEKGVDPDQYSGVGVRISGSNITIRGGRFSGFKVGLHAILADGLTIEDVDVSDNFRQRLHSTPEEEAVEDWLRPHENDQREWMTKYGGGISVESSNNITIRRVRARDVQNGILLSRVNDSRIYDNDCSFLSGWGLAMWRSSENTISRNAFDFCVRGYSHGVYNRGQDSAGILMFEQCSKNIIIENSATHGGDGLFGFAGREALGEVSPRDENDWYQHRGNNENVVMGNDFSYAAAHGIEMTFSFGNVFVRNRLVGNAICGVWGGFSQHSLIALNHIEENGYMPYGRERGGVNIEHGFENRIQENWFAHNAVGVRLWSRENHPLLELPWAKVNHKGSENNVIVYNDFNQDALVAEFDRSPQTRIGRNEMLDVGDFYGGSHDPFDNIVRARGEPRIIREQWDQLPVYGESSPVGARWFLRGREHIVMTEWGPYDWTTPRLHPVKRLPDKHVFYIIGEEDVSLLKTLCRTQMGDKPGPYVNTQRDHVNGTISVTTTERSRLFPYAIEAVTSSGSLTQGGVLVPTTWEVVAFEWKTDPLEDVDRWREEVEVRITEGLGARYTSEHLNFTFGHAGPRQIADAPDVIKRVQMPVDRFGVIAKTQLTFPPGTWRIRTVADDGIRLLLDGDIVIDDWTRVDAGSPNRHSHEFTVLEPRDISLLVEYFEYDGYATLQVDFEFVE